MEQHETEAALLPNIANQMRSLLSNLYLAASQVIPPEQREQDPALDAKAAILEQSFFRLLRLVNSMSAAEYLSDSQTLSLRDADLVKLVSEVCESSADLAEQLGRDPSTISKWCTNVSQPDLVTLSRIAELLNIERRELINKSK